MPKSLLRLLTVMGVVMLFVTGQATRTLAGTTGGINGTITDSAGHPIAAINVTAVALSYRTQTVTGSNGFYAVSGLPPDTYSVTFSKPGYLSQTVPGVTINQDQVYTLNMTLSAEVKTLGRVAVRGSTALVQPTLTVNQYTINPQSIENITGTPQNLSETAVLNALPGITTDNGGYPIIRGGAENDEGFQLEGIDATEPITGQFINSLVLNGVGRLQLSTGGYDVSQGNTNSGVVNIVTKRGVYPGGGEATSRINWPNMDHRLAFDYGNASPDNRYSYYFSFQGARTQLTYGDDKTFLPRLVGQTNYESGNDFVANLFYHWGANNANEFQYYADAGDNLFNISYLIDPRITPYATNNGVTEITTGLGSGLFTSPQVSLVDFAPLFPGQAGFFQNTAYPDHEDENHQIQKLNFKRQFNASSFGDFRVFRTQTTVNFLFPWNGGALGDQYEYDSSDNRGIALDYSNQLNSQHEITFGAETVYTKPNFSIAIPSSTVFTAPLECGLACAAIGLTGTFNPAAPQGYIQPLYNEVQGPLGLPAGLVLPLKQLPDNASHITDNIHRNNAYIRDRWQPNSRFTVTAGLRWDQEIISLPSNASSQNLFYTQDALGNFIDVPGQPIGNDVTRPTQISPRIAISFAANSRDVFKTSYGRFIEFTPVSNIENTYNVEASAANCTIANGCFTALPGFNAACVNGVVPGTGAGCNGISNLRQQIIEDLNKNNFAQYTPVRPQKATSIDFSWEHDFGNGLQMKISPYYRKGTDYVVASTPLLFTLSDGTSVFGSPRESNAGVNKNTGVEFALDKNNAYGWSGFIHMTYDNTLANYNSDFFPSVNVAAVQLGHFFHVSYLAPVTAQINVNYSARNGWHFIGDFPYESGYHYGVGTHTFILQPANGVSGPLVPLEVLNTDLAATALGLNSFTSAYYFTDPTNRGTIVHPNITGSRGTNEGFDPGTLRSPQRMFANITIAHDLGFGAHRMQVGLHVQNLFGNYSNGVVGGNSRYRNNGIGGFASNSGARSGLALPPFNEPYLFPRSPFPYESEPTGQARQYTLYLNARY